MRLGGRLAGAIEVLADKENRRRPVADALKDWGLSRRFAGSGDRAAVGNIVYDALRKKLSHAWLMDDASPAALAHAVMFRQWGISPEQLASELDGDKFAPEPLSAALLDAFRSRSLENAPEHVAADIPEWVVPLFKENFGEQWLTEAQALSERPSLDLRTNTLRAGREKVVDALEEAHAVAARIARQGVRIPPGEGPSRLPNVTAELSFAKGWFEVQDEGSQIVADLVMAGEGEQILDYCAGGGGKTLALSATMRNKGQVHAFDADRKRLAPIIERLRRAGTRNVQVHEREKDLVHLVDKCDRVLVDAPCTGTGTWRRRPDTKWRLTQKNLDERIGQQRQVLDAAARYVRPGGVLCYVTCSLLPQENQGQTRAFVESNGDFEIVSALDGWQSMFGSSGVQPVSKDGATVTLSPASTDTDGFFFAMLKRMG
jgi:16S rRNA (cytosine967-C5)-methyltransferase